MNGRRVKELLIIVTVLAVGVMLGVYLCGASTRDVIFVETENAGSFSVQTESLPAPSVERSSVTVSHSALSVPEQVRQPGASVETVSILDSTPVPSGTAERIDLNSATAQEFESLPGIGEVLAQRIVDYRETNGGFHTTEELLDIKGIGEKTYAKIADYVEVRD